MKKNEPNTQKGKSKKKWIIGATVILVLAAIFGNTGENDTSVPVDGQPQTSASTPSVISDIPEANTTAMVDYLAREAKKAAEGITDEKRDEAVNFIVENYPYFFIDNALMEKTMSYGFLLEYAYGDVEEMQEYSVLGMNVVQAVKYVYRDVETVSDDATMKNLMQVKDSIEKLGYAVN